MSDEVKNLIHQSNVQFGELGAKTTVGLVASFASMSINDWAGLIVAILTGIYMCFQIESAWRNRKAAKIKQKTAETEAQ